MFPTAKTSATSLANMIQDSKVQQQSNNAGKAFLKFAFQTGDFLFGRDQEDVTGETLIINTYSIMHGWTLWVNRSPKKVLVPFNQDLPFPPEAVDGNEPSEARSFEARFEDDESIVVFETNSYGGRSGVDELLAAVKAKALSGEADYLFPVVKLTSTSYTAKQGNVVHNPVFEVIGWANMEGDVQSQTKQLDAPAEDAERVEEEAPVRRRRRKA